MLDDLARYYLKKGEFAQAEPLFTRCLSIVERTFDENDPNIAKVLADFALLRKEMFQINEADALFSRSLTICDAASAAGKNCDDIGMIKNDAAEFYESQKRYKEAEQRYKEALSILKMNAPEGHQDIEKVQKNYDRLKQIMTKDKN